MKHQRTFLVVAAGLVVLAGLVIAVTKRNAEFLYYGGTLLVIGGGIILLDRRVRLPLFVLWGLFLWLILHLAGGMIDVPKDMVDTGMTNYTLYNVRLMPWLPRYDQCVHAFGFFVSSLAAWRGIYVASGRTLKPTFGPRLGAGLMGLGCGAVNEVIEFVGTRLMPDTNVGDFVNTGWDLVSNSVGALIAMLTIRMFHQRWFTYE
jgi:hypothetical protein